MDQALEIIREETLVAYTLFDSANRFLNEMTFNYYQNKTDENKAAVKFAKTKAKETWERYQHYSALLKIVERRLGL